MLEKYLMLINKYSRKLMLTKNLSDKVLITLAIKCIETEAKSYPCFGLVSAKDSGCHNNMNINTFLISSKTFVTYFAAIINLVKVDNNLNFYKLRELGKLQEERMFKVTNNVNTHKGLIFCFGIVFYINYYLLHNKIYCKSPIPIIKKFTAPLKQDFFVYNKNTKGEICYKKYGIKGARGLALEGYEIVYNKGLPLIKSYKILYPSINDEQLSLILLIFYMSEIDDTNLISKVGLQKSFEIKNNAKVLIEILATLGWNDFYSAVILINEQYKKLGVSPGGCADLCVITLFLAKIV